MVKFPVIVHLPEHVNDDDDGGLLTEKPQTLQVTPPVAVAVELADPAVSPVTKPPGVTLMMEFVPPNAVMVLLYVSGVG